MGFFFIIKIVFRYINDVVGWDCFVCVILVIIYLDNSGKFRISYSYVIRFVSGYRTFVCLVINFIFVIMLNSKIGRAHV